MGLGWKSDLIRFIFDSIRRWAKTHRYANISNKGGMWVERKVT